MPHAGRNESLFDDSEMGRLGWGRGTDLGGLGEKLRPNAAHAGLGGGGTWIF